MGKTSALLILFVTVLLFNCSYGERNEKETTKKQQNQKAIDRSNNFFEFDIKELTDEEYPDNPDIGFRASNYSSHYFISGKINYHEDFNATLSFYSEKDTFQLENFQLDEFIPTVPIHFSRKDEYLNCITLVNQEWNRNQVRLSSAEFKTNNPEISRIDISRNCLNAYLWEIIAYTEEDGEELPIYHGWFDFPQQLYASLFEEKNDLAYGNYREPLEHWEDPENKTFDESILRTIVGKKEISFKDESDKMYPLKGARLKKRKEIIHPEEFETMRELQSDDTKFATFSPPGIYNKQDPRNTELGRIYKLENIEVNKTECPSNNERLKEIVFSFFDRDNERQTKLIIGGLDFDQFPKLSVEQANKGWKNSMGFGNHPFYEDYKEHLSWKLSEACYYGYLTNDKDEWLNSHHIGIDGPMIHWDDKIENRLHVWLLSFERHALVGHYVIDFLG